MTVRTAVLVLLAAATAALGAPAAAQARSCTPPKYPGQGYFTTLQVTGTSCAGGRDLMRAHYRCRTKRGVKGRCARAGGYTCSETRRSIPTEFNARVSCRTGGRRVVFPYQQTTCAPGAGSARPCAA